MDIAVIDYGAGNLRSVVRALSKVGCRSIDVTSKPGDILNAQAVVMPGVGAAGDAVATLNRLGISDAIRDVIRQGRPFLGVCLGLQVLFDTTEEGGLQPCLGVLPGEVKLLRGNLKVPHMGWNSVLQKRPHPVFDGIPEGTQFYFVHSYYASPAQKELVAGETEYGVRFCSALIKDNLIATQFHPEKSGTWGLRFYENFVRYALGGGSEEASGNNTSHRP